MKSSLLLPGIALLLAAGCARHDTPPPTTTLPPAKVRVAQVQVVTLPQVTEVTGTIRPVRRATLAARVMGEIIELPVILGQAVRAALGRGAGAAGQWFRRYRRGQ